jgi:hypothetical protein
MGQNLISHGSGFDKPWVVNKVLLGEDREGQVDEINEWMGSSGFWFALTFPRRART